MIAINMLFIICLPYELMLEDCALIGTQARVVSKLSAWSSNR